MTPGPPSPRAAIGWGRRLGRTRLGFALWQAARRHPLAARAVEEASWAATALGHMLARRRPDHRVHDRQQRALLAAFEAETRAGR